MAELFYKDERDSDFFLACEHIRKEAGQYIPITEIATQAVLKPAKSFYLHRRIYSNIIRTNGKRLPTSPVKQQLHLEIIRIYNELRKENPDKRTHEITSLLEQHPAPRYYISDRRAIDLYYHLLKNPPPFI